MSKRDYYEVLDVERGADAAALKKAYRRVAMKNHPDRNPDNPDAENIFKEANEAFEVLSDKDKRARYDQYGHAGVDGQTSAGGADFGDMFGDIFGDIFGGGRGGGGRSHVRKGADLRYNLDLSLEDAVRGTTVKIQIPTTVTCGPVTVLVLRKARSLSTAQLVAAMGRFACNRGFSLCSKRVRAVRAQANRLKILAIPVMGAGRFVKTKRCRLRCQQVLIRAIAYASQARVKPASTVDRQAICTLR